MISGLVVMVQIAIMLLLAALVCIVLYCLGFHVGQRKLNKELANAVNDLNRRVKELEVFRGLSRSMG